jgi:hypothetical protein
MAWQGQAGPEDAGGGGSIGGISAEVRMDATPLAADMARVNGMLAELERRFGITASASKQLGAGLVLAGGGMTSLASKMMLVGQFADDMQYGFRAIVNQVPQVAMAFGMGAGLAGGLSVAAVAANQLINNWGQLQGMMGTGIPVPALEGLEKTDARLKEVNKRIDELRGKGRLSLPESGELGNLTAERTRLGTEAAEAREIERITGGASREDAARGAGFNEAVRASGGRTALDELVSALADRVNARGEVGVVGAEVGTPQRVAEELFRNAARGDAVARESIRRTLPGSPFAGRIAEMSPETAARREAEDRFEREGVERARERQRAGQSEEERVLQAEQDRNVAAFDEAQRVKAATGPMTIAGALAAGRRNQDHFARMQRLGDRLRDVMTPEVSQSQVFGMSDLNARVQSSVTNGPDRLLRVQQETKKVLDDIRETVRAFNRPVKVGGR